MKILHTSDLHIGKSLNGFSLLEYQSKMLNDLVCYMTSNNIKKIIIAGDIFDKSLPSSEAMNVFSSFLVKLYKSNIEAYIISGNHDSNLRLDYLSTILDDNKIHINTFDIKFYEEENVRIYLLPFIHFIDFKEKFHYEITSSEEGYSMLLNSIDLDNNYYNILVAHDYFANVNDDLSCESERPIYLGDSEYINTSLLDKFDYVALGHIHKAMSLGNKIFYSGSPLKYSFSEIKNHNKVFIIDTCLNNVVAVEIPSSYQFVELEGKLDDLLNDKTFYDKENTLFKITVLDKQEIPNLANRIKEIYHNTLEIIKKNDFLYNNLDLKMEKKSITELFSDFYKMITDEDLTKEECQILKEVVVKIDDH